MYESFITTVMTRQVMTVLTAPPQVCVPMEVVWELIDSVLESVEMELLLLENNAIGVLDVFNN